MFPAPFLSAQPSLVVASGGNVSLSCRSEYDDARPAHLLKEGGAGPLHSLEARFSHVAGVWQATFLLGPVDGTQGGIYRCYCAHSRYPHVWSLPSEPLELQVTGGPEPSSPSHPQQGSPAAPAPEDHTMENLIRMGVVGLVLLGLGVLLVEAWYSHKRTRAAGRRCPGERTALGQRSHALRGRDGGILRAQWGTVPQGVGAGSCLGASGALPPFSCGLLPCGCVLSCLALRWDSATFRPHVDPHPPPALPRPQGAFCSVSDECSSQCACVRIRVPAKNTELAPRNNKRAKSDFRVGEVHPTRDAHGLSGPESFPGLGTPCVWGLRRVTWEPVPGSLTGGCLGTA
uniref:Immunoglobulin-like beta-sandwich domain-containing protein n=1 Tax=Oryctolagus cuniculus TaxID=9986 RepID=G1TJ60_RABIT